MLHFSIGFAWAPRVIPVHHWVFVDYRNMVKHKVHHHLLASGNKKKYYEQTNGKPSGDRRTFGNVPDRRDVERRGNVRVTETRVRKETYEQKRPDPGRVAPVPRLADRDEDRGKQRIDSQRRSLPDRTPADREHPDRTRVQTQPEKRIAGAGRGTTGRVEQDADDKRQREERTPQRVSPVR